MQAPEPPICDYEGSDYQSSFWEQGGRAYEDRVEAIALRRLLPRSGQLLLEVGAGAGRNTPRYSGFERVVLLDFSLTQLQQAQARLGTSPRHIYVAGDVYRLPFLRAIFDAATMIRVLHHMADAPRALAQVRETLAPGAVFILEFANKRNLKSILRYLLGRQTWNPFSLEPVEFARLNFDFHPREVERWLSQLGLQVERKLTVSHFRAGLLKRWVPAKALACLDSVLQPTGAVLQYTPSVFFRSSVLDGENSLQPRAGRPALLFKCPNCGGTPLSERGGRLVCPECASTWAIVDGIYDFRRPISRGTNS